MPTPRQDSKVITVAISRYIEMNKNGNLGVPKTQIAFYVAAQAFCLYEFLRTP